MYKEINFRINPQCLDGDTQAYLVDGLENIGFKTDLKTEILNIGTALENIVDNCMYDECLNDWLTYCYEMEDACEPTNMMQTLLKKVFQVTTVANDFGQQFGEGIPTEEMKPQVIEDWFDRFGSNFGKLVRYASEFDPNILP